MIKNSYAVIQAHLASVRGARASAAADRIRLQPVRLTGYNHHSRRTHLVHHWMEEMKSWEESYAGRLSSYRSL